MKNDAIEARFHLDGDEMQEEVLNLDSSTLKMIRKLIPEHERSKYMHFIP